MRRRNMPDEIDAFHKLCRRASPEEIAEAIKKGASTTAVNEEQMTALMWAAADTPDPDALHVLINAGADLEARDECGMTALMWAARRNHNPTMITALLSSERLSMQRVRRKRRPCSLPRGVRKTRK